MEKVYLAGPMSGLPALNFRAFHRAAQHLRRHGYTVVSPAEMDMDLDGFTPTDEDTVAPHPFKHYMQRDLPALLQCDAIVVLPEWEDSKGATLEAHVADACGMEVFTFTEAMLR